MDKKTKQNKMGKIVKTPRYTLEAWCKLFPESSHDEWDVATSPFELMSFVSSDLLVLEDGDALTVVVLDDEYIQWLGERKNDDENRQKYMDSLSEEDILRLAIKNDLNCTYHMYIYPVPITPKELRNPKTRKLTIDTQLMFMEYLKNVTKNDAYVFPYLLNVVDLCDIEERIVDYILFSVAQKYFETGKHITNKELNCVSWDPKTQPPLYAIPIIIKEVHDTMTFKRFETDEGSLKHSLYNVELDQETLNFYNVDVIPFFLTEIPQSIKKNLKITAQLKNFPCALKDPWEVGIWSEKRLEVIEANKLFIDEEYHNSLNDCISFYDIEGYIDNYFKPSINRDKYDDWIYEPYEDME